LFECLVRNDGPVGFYTRLDPNSVGYLLRRLKRKILGGKQLIAEPRYGQLNVGGLTFGVGPVGKGRQQRLRRADREICSG
jgi:hypothetical protein